MCASDIRGATRESNSLGREHGHDAVNLASMIPVRLTFFEGTNRGEPPVGSHSEDRKITDRRDADRREWWGGDVLQDLTTHAVTQQCAPRTFGSVAFEEAAPRMSVQVDPGTATQ